VVGKKIRIVCAVPRSVKSYCGANTSLIAGSRFGSRQVTELIHRNKVASADKTSASQPAVTRKGGTWLFFQPASMNPFSTHWASGRYQQKRSNHSHSVYIWKPCDVSPLLYAQRSPTQAKEQLFGRQISLRSSN
jgi:hypothetical protein